MGSRRESGPAAASSSPSLSPVRSMTSDAGARVARRVRFESGGAARLAAAEAVRAREWEAGGEGAGLSGSDDSELEPRRRLRASDRLVPAARLASQLAALAARPMAEDATEAMVACDAARARHLEPPQNGGGMFRNMR